MKHSLRGRKGGNLKEGRNVPSGMKDPLEKTIIINPGKDHSYDELNKDSRIY